MEEQIARLTALLVQQSELAAQAQREASQRNEQLATMLERVLVQDRPLSQAPSGAVLLPTEGAAAVASPPARLPAGGITAPFLVSSASLREFGTWRQKLKDYRLLTRLDSLSVGEQRAAVMSLLDDDWARTVRYTIKIPQDADIESLLDAMEAHLRGQRSVMLDRREFYSRIQLAGETFDDFLCSIKEIAAYCDFCTHCLDDQYRDRIVTGTSDEEALKLMLHERDLTLQRAVDICRACETATVNSAALRGENAQIGRLSAYRRQRRVSPDSRPTSDRRDKCDRCGRRPHAERDRCPAWNVRCYECGVLGHFAAVCPSPRGSVAQDRTGRPRDLDTVAAGRARDSRSRDSARGRRPSGQPREGSPPGYGRQQRSDGGAAEVRLVLADVCVESIGAEPTPTIVVTVKHPTGVATVAGTPDTGAEASVMGADTATSLGITAGEAAPSARFTTAGRTLSPVSDSSKRRWAWGTAKLTLPSSY